MISTLRAEIAQRTTTFLALLAVSLVSPAAQADVTMPAIFSDHAVLQRDVKLPVWGWAKPGEIVEVSLAGQKQQSETDDSGRWQVTFAPLALGEPLTMMVEGKNRIEIKDLLVGDVWLCSGQSNMEWRVEHSLDPELEIPAANYPDLRLLKVKNEGDQNPQVDSTDHWQRCTPQTAESFSAVGYYFGRELQQIERVPIGMIDNSWGGSSCEAWIRRDLLEGNELYQPLLERWNKTMADFDADPASADFRSKYAEWQKKDAEGRKSGQPNLAGRPQWNSVATNNIRPASLYNGRICPIAPYAIRGAIWYQGETNVDRAYQYREMFPLMVKTWREKWGQGDFPFYWVQLADFKDEIASPGDSDWAELREAQTMALDKVTNSGQAVIIDIGEANDIHPRDKQTVAKRLARLALADTYGRKLSHDSPSYEKMERRGDAIVVRLSNVNGKLVTFDNKPATGFAIAGNDRKWVWADAQIVGDNEIEIRSDAVPEPVAVRYAWADNPVCNLYDSVKLPVTPFRTDDWPGITANAR
jgi:sialate O-acetylesterase